MKTTKTYIIAQPNGDENEYETREQAIDALQYYPQGEILVKTVTLETIMDIATELDLSPSTKDGEF